ncbi:hypothetical protein CR513_13644, partial [Mucuna pruriens]
MAMGREMAKLREVRFIKGSRLHDSNEKWRMCVDNMDLKKACPKDSYPLLSIDQLVDGASEFQVLNLLDAYSGYNQIKMYPLSNEEKITFMIDGANYYYQVMPFDLKNVGATYQRLMDKDFANQIVRNLEVYVGDMVVKSISPEQQI